MEIFRKFISGKYSLLSTFWFVAVPAVLVWKLIGHYGDLKPGSMVAIAYVATGSLITFICTLAVWNSAGNYLGQATWKWLARVLCVPPLFVVFSLAFMLLNKPNVSTQKADGECKLYWDDTKREFTKFSSNSEQHKNLKQTSFVKKGKADYANSLYPQLRKADLEGNKELANSIAAEIRAVSIVVYYNPSFSVEYIETLVRNNDISNKCF